MQWTTVAVELIRAITIVSVVWLIISENNGSIRQLIDVLERLVMEMRKQNNA